jgi:hypothetical protein
MSNIYVAADFDILGIKYKNPGFEDDIGAEFSKLFRFEATISMA